MTTGVEFGAELEAQDKELTARQQQLDKDRADWRTLALAYVNLLRARGRELPAFAKTLEPPSEQLEMLPDLSRPRAAENGLDRYGRPYDGVTRVYRIGAPRIGEKRRVILLCIAKATKEGREITSREIVNETGQDYHLVVNTMWMDEKRGILRYTDGHKNTMPGKAKKVVMTDSGFDILERAGLLGDPANE